MKAIIYTAYGGPDVLHLQEVERPSPKSNEVLIRIRAVSVNFGDLIARNYKNISPKAFNMPLLFWILARFAFGFSKPKRTILGNTFAGEVEQVGKSVKILKEGDQVFGFTGEGMGTYAEFLCIPENGILTKKPSNMSFEEASTIPYGALMAMDLLRKVNIQKGQRVLVIGASGAIGSAAVQLIRNHYDAEVTGVCSLESLEYVKRLGAHKVMDYQQRVRDENEETYDLIIDILGKSAFSKVKTSLKRNGIYFPVSFKMKKLLQMLWTSIVGGKKVKCALASPKSEDLIFVKDLIEEGKYTTVIDKTFPLEKMAEAHLYMENGNKKGNIAIKVSEI